MGKSSEERGGGSPAGPRKGTVGWLAAEAPARAAKGQHPVDWTLEQLKGDLSSGDLDRRAPGSGIEVARTASAGDIKYTDLGPEPLWGAPYTVLRAKVDLNDRETLMFHAGEEILIPIVGSVVYDVVESARHDRITRKVVHAGSAIRMNPQLPHHGKAGKEGTEAWMVMRSVTEAGPAIVRTDSTTVTDKKQRARAYSREVTLEELKDPVTYSLITWGIAEALWLYRVRANLTVVQVAAQCGVDPTALARIEGEREPPRASTESTQTKLSRDRSTNITTVSLLKVARFLRLPLRQMILQSKYDPQIVAFKDKSESNEFQRLFDEPDYYLHRLHCSFLRLDRGKKTRISKGISLGTFETWIVVKGNVLLTVPGLEDKIGVEKGGLIHFRSTAPVAAEASEDAEVVRIVYCSACVCP